MSRRSLTLRGVAAAALLPLALGSLSACGEDDGEPEAASSDTAETTTKSAAEADADDTADGADVTAGETVTKNDFMDLYRASVEKLTTAEITLEAEVEGGAMTAEGVVDYGTDPAAMQMSYSDGEQDVELIMVDDAMYMSSPQLGEKWLTFDLKEAAEGLGINLGAQMDMREMLDTFESGLTKVVYVGEADVEGDEADQYRVTLDTEALTGELDLKDLGAEAEVPATMDFDIFFDDEDQFRRMDLDMGKSGAMTMGFDNWGTDVEIEAPPARDTTSMEEMMGGLEKSAS